MKTSKGKQKTRLWEIVSIAPEHLLEENKGYYWTVNLSWLRATKKGRTSLFYWFDVPSIFWSFFSFLTNYLTLAEHTKNTKAER